MAKKSTKKKNQLHKQIVALVLMGIVTFYVLTNGMKTIQLQTDFQNNMLNVKGTIDYFMSTTIEDQLAISVISILILGFIIKQMNLKKKKYEDASEFGVHGDARFGEINELIESNAISTNNKFSKTEPFKSLDVEEGLVVGVVPGKNEMIIIPSDTSIDNRNILVIGSSGSGKGQSFVFPNIINNRSSTMIITDPKGEIYDATHQLKRDQGYKVYQIDFLNLEGDKYNALDYVFNDMDAKKVALTIARNSSKEGKEDFWFNTAADLLTGLIIFCKSFNKKASMQDIKKEYYKISEDENYLKEVCEQIGAEHPAYNYLKDASVSSGNTRSGILSSFATQTGIFSMGKVARLTSQSDFNFYDFQKEKSILYVKIPMKSNPVESLTATFFDQLIDTLYLIADQNNGRLPIPTIMLLDEFANLGKINDYDGTLSTCRGLGIGMVTVIQDFGQLDAKYGKELARTIRSNHDTHLFLATKDPETAKYYSELAGSTTVRMKTESNSRPSGLFSTGNSSTSSAEQYVKRELIPASDLTIKDKDECYLFITNQNPFKLEKAYQFNIYSDFLFGKDRLPNYYEYSEKYKKFLKEKENSTNKESNSKVSVFKKKLKSSKQDDAASQSPTEMSELKTSSTGGQAIQQEVENSTFESQFAEMINEEIVEEHVQENDAETKTESIQEYKDTGNELLSFEDDTTTNKNDYVNEPLHQEEKIPLELEESIQEEQIINNSLISFEEIVGTNQLDELNLIIENANFDTSNLIKTEESLNKLEKTKDLVANMDIFLTALNESEKDLENEMKDELDFLSV
ncbi:VirD4-like conjugal transfer protein, CD1115 family [Gottfriedia solisilvae]|uniref:VirD4-like conjugal transfer protein, CD1115 family n=1 Tax=Gottfriedia solisilvae TaxID=1516104 RepID=UPI003D2F1A1F